MVIKPLGLALLLISATSVHSQNSGGPSEVIALRNAASIEYSTRWRHGRASGDFFWL